jgi:hypothetical protein
MLYGHRLRHEMGQPGLVALEQGGVGAFLHEALWLVECALIERSADLAGDWRRGIRRAADLLEFISQNDLRPPATPVHLLAAAAYQVAGFPAMALAQLAHRPADEQISGILWNFLRADFPATLEQVRQYWTREREIALPDNPEGLSVQATRHVVMCIGTICSYFRTGDDAIAGRAVNKLHGLADGYLLSRDPYSHLLARLTALAGEEFVQSSMWRRLSTLLTDGDEAARAAFQQYARSAFVNRRAGIGRSAGDDYRPVAVATPQSCAVQQLAKSANEPHCGSRAEGGPVVLIHAIVET